MTAAAVSYARIGLPWRERKEELNDRLGVRITRNGLELYKEEFS